MNQPKIMSHPCTSENCLENDVLSLHDLANRTIDSLFHKERSDVFWMYSAANILQARMESIEDPRSPITPDNMVEFLEGFSHYYYQRHKKSFSSQICSIYEHFHETSDKTQSSILYTLFLEIEKSTNIKLYDCPLIKMMTMKHLSSHEYLEARAESLSIFKERLKYSA